MHNFHCFCVLFVIFLINNLCLSATTPPSSTKTLKFVHLLFRHGDRTNMEITTYKNDPFRNEKYYPFGNGMLTNKGRKTAYKLGSKLRKRYGEFLGPTFTPDLVLATSSDTERTKNTLQLVLAGLFPPVKTENEWEKELNWQPIAFDIFQSTNHILTFPNIFCASHNKSYLEYLKSREGQQIEYKYHKIYDDLTKATGQSIQSTFDLRLLYFGLITEKEWGMALPEWTEKVFPHVLERATIDFYLLTSATPRLKQLTGANHRRLAEKARRAASAPERKLLVYAGHEYNIFYVLNALGFVFPQLPPYAACVIFEVHTINGVDGFKVFYEEYNGGDMEPLNIKGCGDFCPYDKFVALLNQVLPPGDEICDEGATVNEILTRFYAEI